jgi:hypothetical protein
MFSTDGLLDYIIQLIVEEDEVSIWHIFRTTGLINVFSGIPIG